MLLSERMQWNNLEIKECRARHDGCFYIAHNPFELDSVRKVAKQQLEECRFLLEKKTEDQKRLAREYRALLRQVPFSQVEVGWGKIY